MAKIIKIIMQECAFSILSANEVTMIKTNSGKCPCLYDEKLGSHSNFTSARIEMGAITGNIMVIILYNVVKFGHLVEEQLTFLWVCLGCDIYFVFQGHYIGVISQI
jgi:hypothetical protein